MKIKSIIIDDDKVNVDRVKQLLQNYNCIELTGYFDDGIEAIDYINCTNPDIVFLNTKIKGLSGFEIIKKISLDIKPLFVFITSYKKCAAKAFDYLVFDFILKPFDHNRFHQAIDNIISYYKKENLLNMQVNIENMLSLLKQENIEGKKIAIKSGNKISFLNINEIKYISASGYYVEIFTTCKKYLLRDSLSNLITKLDCPKFIRIHRSTIINSDFIEEIITSSYGENDVKIFDIKPTFRVSKSFKKDFQKFIGVK